MLVESFSSTDSGPPSPTADVTGAECHRHYDVITRPSADSVSSTATQPRPESPVPRLDSSSSVSTQGSSVFFAEHHRFAVSPVPVASSPPPAGCISAQELVNLLCRRPAHRPSVTEFAAMARTCDNILTLVKWEDGIGRFWGLGLAESDEFFSHPVFVDSLEGKAAPLLHYALVDTSRHAYVLPLLQAGASPLQVCLYEPVRTSPTHMHCRLPGRRDGEPTHRLANAGDIAAANEVPDNIQLLVPGKGPFASQECLLM